MDIEITWNVKSLEELKKVVKEVRLLTNRHTRIKVIIKKEA